jgi:DNA-binding CsgD family transcriptional regulator
MLILRRDPRSALLARVFAVHTAVMLVAVTFLVVTPLTVSWPLRPSELIELVAWSVALLLTDYIALRALFGSRVNLRRARARDDELTTRGLEVVRLIANGHTAKEIAAILFISPKTVDAHRGHILEKLGLRDRVALTRYAIKRGLIEP